MHKSITAHVYVWNMSALNHWIGNNAGFPYRPRFLLTSEQWQAANYPNVHWSLQGSPRMQWPLKVKCFFPSIHCFRNEETLRKEHLKHANVPVLWVSTIWPTTQLLYFQKFPMRVWNSSTIPRTWGYKSASRWKTQAIIKFSQSQRYSFTRHRYIIHV